LPESLCVQKTAGFRSPRASPLVSRATSGNTPVATTLHTSWSDAYAVSPLPAVASPAGALRSRESSTTAPVATSTTTSPPAATQLLLLRMYYLPALFVTGADASARSMRHPPRLAVHGISGVIGGRRSFCPTGSERAMRVTATVLKRRARVLPVLCLAIGLSGCFWARGSGEARGMIGWKTVMRKMDPVYLIAVDGSQCTVTEEKFKKAKEGERFFCAWSGGAVATRPEGRPYPD